MKLLFSILLTTSLFAQKEYDIKNVYQRASDKIYIKKFSEEKVNGSVYQMFGDQKVILGKMVNGKKEGKWLRWYDSGVKKEERIYSKNKLDGKSYTYYESGSIENILTFDKDVPISLVIYFENGQKKAEGKTNSDFEPYLRKMWDEKGQLKSELNLDKISLSGVERFFEKGKLTEVNYYKNNLKHGIDTIFTDNGSIESTIEWANGKKNGDERIYSKGSLYSISKYKDDKKFFYRSMRDSLNFVEDSLLVYTILEKGYKGADGVLFRVDNSGEIYRWASTDEVLYKKPNLSGFKVFPIRRSLGSTDFVVLTNSKNEALGYLVKNQWKFKNIMDSRAFNKDFNFLSRKYERDGYVFKSVLEKNKEVDFKLSEEYMKSIKK